MEWVISILVLLSLIGSVMWIKPSPRERMQSQMRLHARKAGLVVQLAQLETPRARGETEPTQLRLTAYRLLRRERARSHMPSSVWQVFRIDNIASEGLPSGWSWKQGERSLSAEQLASLHQLLEALPRSVLALDSNPQQLSLYWREEGGIERVDQLVQVLHTLQEKGL